MDDPLSALVQSLDTVFHLAVKRNGRYTYREIQRLEKSIHAYSKQPSTANFKNLNHALNQSFPHIKQWRIDIESIKKALDTLAKQHAYPKYSQLNLTFHFSASHQSGNLSAWINTKTGKASAQLNHSQLTQALIDYRNHSGFSLQLNSQLKKEPDFLFNLIIQSEKNFMSITKTRLILYLTDEQLAKAIIKHLNALVVPLQKKDEQEINLSIEKLNELLSNGRSISTLLRNANAKVILDDAELFRLYQSDEQQPTIGY